MKKHLKTPFVWQLPKMEIATNILIAYARVGAVCPHPYGRACALLNNHIFEPFFLFQPAILAVRTGCGKGGLGGRDQHGLFCHFCQSRARYFSGFEGVAQRCFLPSLCRATLPMPVNRHRNSECDWNRPVFSGSCQENLGSCGLVTKCNHLVDFNKVAISCEKLFLIRPNSPELNSLKLQEIKTPEFGGIKRLKKK